MIYKVLKVLVKMTMFFFFKKRIIKNAENIPASGPTILVANHPVTFLDPLLAAVATKRQVHFLAKGVLFKNGLIRAIFKKFNMIPVYRAQDNPSDMSKNQDTFRYCYEHLEKGGLIMIFPEGISITDRTLKPLKTGVARIALGAEARNDFELGVKIVPIGLTYEAPHEFRKDVLVNIGKPINISAYKEPYGINDRKTVTTITNEIRGNLEKLVLNVNDPILTPTVDFLIRENAQKEVPFETSVSCIKQVIADINDQSTELEVQNLASRMDELIQKKTEIGLKDLNTFERRKSILMDSLVSIITLFVGVPMLIFGFIHNAIPYYLSPRLAKLISKEYEFQGPITMTAGMVLCLILYPIFFVLMLSYSDSWLIALIYMVSLPIGGILTYGFVQQLNWLKLEWKFLILFHKRSDKVAELILEKRAFLKDLYAGHSTSLLANDQR